MPATKTAPPALREPSIAYYIQRIGTRLEEAVNRVARPDGLRIEGVRVLVRLATHESMSLGELAQSVSVEQSALTHMTQRMAKDGLLRRIRSPIDGRTVLISLTKTGSKLAAKYAPFFDRLAIASNAGMSASEQRALRTTLEHIYRNLEPLTVANLDDRFV